ncbi:MAG: tRNA (N6-threonylcarbamoyladenosine(37)-N6)-methyltransferase TrmO [Thermovirgaceae bacterium]
MKGYGMYPIGFVRSVIKVPQPPEIFRRTSSAVEVEETYRDALEGIREGQSVLVLFVFHKSNGFSMKVHPRGDVNRPVRGLFTTCSPARPNPVGVTPVEVLKINGCRLTVKGLDAIDGTPVIDIKPLVRDYMEGLEGRR